MIVSVLKWEVEVEYKKLLDLETSDKKQLAWPEIYPTQKTLLLLHWQHSDGEKGGGNETYPWGIRSTFKLGRIVHFRSCLVSSSNYRHMVDAKAKN